MRILVACEKYQRVTVAFRNRGHEAYSCDIQDTAGEHPEWHFKGDVLKYLSENWDMMIAFPPCTYLSYAGMAKWNESGRLEKRLKALDFFARLWLAPIEKICIENPRGCASPTIAKYSQEIHPYYFGDSELKRTCLWLKNLPNLEHYESDTLFEKKTHVRKPKPKYYLKNGKKKGQAVYFTESLGGGQSEKRSITFPGIAEAMADQWG